MIRKDYLDNRLSGNKVILFAFCLFLIVRLLTELPRMLREVGWSNNAMSNYDLNRFISFALLAFCFFLISVKRKISMPPLLMQVTFSLLIFFSLSVILASYNFTKLGMPLTGIFVVLSRFMMELVLIIFVMNFIRSRSDLEFIFAYFFKPALFAIVFIALVQILTISYADVQGVFRVTGPFGSPTTLAGFLHLFIALTFYYWRSRSVNFWILIAVEYAILFFTGSVASLVANLVFIILIAKKQKWYKLKHFYLMLPIVLTAFIGSALYKWESILIRLQTLINVRNFQLPPGSSIQWRWDAWKQYISLLGDSLFNWVFGLGIGNQRWILHPEYPNSLWHLFDAPGTHNDYLAVLVDFGIIGLIFFIFIVWVVHRAIRRAEQVDPKLYFLRFYFYTTFVIMISENYIDQLIMFVFIVFLASIIEVAAAETEPIESNMGSPRIT